MEAGGQAEGPQPLPGRGRSPRCWSFPGREGSSLEVSGSPSSRESLCMSEGRELPRARPTPVFHGRHGDDHESCSQLFSELEFCPDAAIPTGIAQGRKSSVDLRAGGAGHTCSPSAAQGLSRGSCCSHPPRACPGGVLRPLGVSPSAPSPPARRVQS